MNHIKSTIWVLLFAMAVSLLSSPIWAQDGNQHTLTLKASPTMAGSFNQSSASLANGETIQLVAYANTNWTFVHWADEQGSVLSGSCDFTFTMTNADRKLTAVYQYNPANPANPVRNYWNKLLGEVIIDDFTTGQLQSAVQTAINGSKNTDVLMITVAGVMNGNDLGVINNYSACTLLDLSRVTGINNIPSYAFDYTKLESVYLPSTIESIGYRAFYSCQQLSSLTVYAMTPPSLDSNVFTGIPEGLVVYVPAAAISQYQEANGWKDFTILPIQEDIRSISVSLPDGASAADYTKMWLELTNTKSGQRMHFVITDRTQYTFANIIRNTSWNVTLRNERGDIFGQIDNVEVKDEDVSVTFASLSKPQTVALSVLTPDGQDVTAQTQVTWVDASGSYLAQGISLTGLPIDYKATYRVALSQNLAMNYVTPQQVDYVLTDGNNKIICQLSPIPQVQITGKVKDVATGLPISGATISASQTFGGKYNKTLNAKTDGNGAFTLAIADVPTSVAFAASDYISQTRDFSNNELSELNELEDMLLKPISGATISLGFTYTTCDGETQNWYSDYNNVSYSLFNTTKQRAISQYNVQYPQIVLLEEVDEGDVLQLKASSRTGAFKPVEATATISEQEASASFDILELGKINASFATTGNASVVGSLYDGTGKLLKTYNYSDASLTISDLTDGQYTLVSMGSSRLFNTIYDLAQLPQTGLIKDVDYALSQVEVESGHVTSIAIDEVPTLDESKLYYTGDNTSFTVNKPSIVAGNYLTLTGRIDFKPAYATNVSNVQMIVDLPESCQFVENSVMVGNSTSSYTLNGSRITIPMARYTDRVRFCVIPTLGGEYAPSAFAQFDLNGETVTQPIGSANYTAKDLSISVPSTVAKTTIPVSGTAIGLSSVEIYDNDVMIGQTTSLANGTWATTCELNEPYNLSFHNIIAKVKTKQGIELQSDVQECRFDMNAIQISKVTMYHWNPEMHTMFESVFDYQNPSSKPNQWTVYYPKKQFTYTIDFTNNSPEKVSNVILYIHSADGQKVPLYPTYDAQKDLWTANIDMGCSSNGYYPVNVSVDFDCDIELDSISTASLFDNATNTKPNEEIELTNIESEGNILNADYVFGDSQVRLSGTFATTNDLPKDVELQTDSVFDNFIIHTNCDYETNKISVYIPKLTLSYLAEQKDSISQHFYNWANTICTKSYLIMEMIVMEEDSQESPLQARRASAIGHTFYAVMTGRRFYSMSKDAQEHFSQSERLWDRVERLCDDYSEYKEDLKAAIERLFEQYFNIKTTATFMQSSRMKMTSPLYAISYMGGWFNFAAEVGFSTQRRHISNTIAGFESGCPQPDSGGPTGSAAPTRNGQPDDDVKIDPSGYVYEGVTSNRLQGVTATAYYKENVEDMYGDLHENIVKWDAAEYAQENPLFTDEYGMYRWDVPQGLWQVKFEKEGYETTYSEWLPVPPPQLEVNIAMKQNVQPTVKMARAYEDAVEVEFDKYMMPELLTAENIMVMQNGMAVKGTVELLNEEVSYEGETETFASKIRFNAAKPFTEQEITLMVLNRVKSYAGIRMQDNYQQTFTIEQEVKEIACDSLITIGYGNTKAYTVSVLPASAAVGKTLNVKSSSPMILSVEAGDIVIGDDGKATISMTGELPGTAGLTFSVEGTDKTTTTIVCIDYIANLTVISPTSNIPSGTALEKGAQITLSCNTEGARIYYTVDGSCPCDEAHRILYEEALTITEDVLIKAIAVKEGMYDSDIVTLNYSIVPTGYVSGDANGDGVVDALDVVLAISYYLGEDVYLNFAAADVVADGEINALDVVAMQDIYLNTSHQALAPRKRKVKSQQLEQRLQ